VHFPNTSLQRYRYANPLSGSRDSKKAGLIDENFAGRENEKYYKIGGSYSGGY
jgi:hypothetical protein